MRIVCAHCGQEIKLGQEYYHNPHQSIYLHCACLRGWHEENMDYVEQVFAEGHMECGELEDDDPYRLYGVSRGEL